MLRGISARINLRVVMGAEPSSPAVRIGAVGQVELAGVKVFGSCWCREWFGLCVFNAFCSELSPGGVLVTPSTGLVCPHSCDGEVFYRWDTEI